MVDGGGSRVVEMRGIGKSFSGVKVLDAVDFTVDRGEVVALLGANGAGKSTLIKILSGVYRKDEGVIRIEGREANFLEPADAIRAGVRMMPQEIHVIPDMTVRENICIGDIPVGRSAVLPTVRKREMNERARAALTQLGLEGMDPGRLLRDMRLSERRIVEIARAINGQSKILIMDEPTAALGESDRNRLFEVIARIKSRGIGIVYISHYLDEVFRLADRVVVLRDGINAGEFARDKLDANAVMTAMLGKKLGSQYPQRAHSEAGTVFRAEGFAVQGVIHAMDFAVGAGEIVGVHGLIGSGIEDFGKFLCGAAKRDLVSGKFTLGGRDYRPSSPEYARGAGIGFVPPDRKREGILPDMSVRENITISILEQFRALWGLAMRRRTERESVRDLIHDVGIKASGPEQKIRFLSGGNQQKACLARWLNKTDLVFLILQEPTYGVDIGARRDIYDLLQQLSARGVGILVISTDVEEVCGLSDRILVLRRGRLEGEFQRGASNGEIMHTAAGTGNSIAAR